MSLHTSNLHSLPLLARGKVRDNYAVGQDRILMVASDRISAFDVIMGEPIPGKGELLTKMALFTYLIDTATIGGSTRVISRSEQANLLNQENRISQRGGINEAALSYAANMDDRLYLGLSIGFPFINYSRYTQWKEEDAAGKGNNEFAYSNYTENYTLKGLGFNVKMGMIIKPVQSLRIGFALHTPSLYTLTEKTDGEMTTDIDTARGTTKVFTVKTGQLYNGVPQYEYGLNSPWRLMAEIGRAHV